MAVTSLIAWTSPCYNTPVKTTQNCLVCGIEFTRFWAKTKMPPKHCSRACANRAPGRMTPEIRQRIGRSGIKNNGYKGGQWMVTDKTGKPRVFVALSAEEQKLYGLKRPYMPRSRYAWNKAHPDNPLRRHEVIHHIDGDTLNDALENLQRMPSQAAHARHHFAGRPHSPEHIAKQVAAARLTKAKRREQR